MTAELTSIEDDPAFATARDPDQLVRLRRTCDQLMQIMDSLPGLVGYVDLDFTIVYANRLIEDWYRQPRESLVGMQLKTLFSEEHYRTVEALLQRVLSGEEINDEREISYPDGVTRQVHLNYIPDFDGDRVNGYFFLVRDVSQRYRAEVALKQANELLDRKVRDATIELQHRNEALQRENIARRQSEDRYRIVSELMSDLIYVYQVDADGAMNSVWQTGRLSQEFSPVETEDGHHRLWRPIVHPDDAVVLDQRIERLLRNQSSVDEFRVIDKNGYTRWLRAYGRPIWDDDQQRVSQIMVATQDITETKVAEQLLERNRQMLAAALESMSDGFMLFDENGRLVEFNEKLKQLFPKTAPHFVKGVRFEELLRLSAESGEVKQALHDPEAWLEQRLGDYPSETGTFEVELTDGRWILSTDRPTRGRGVVGIRTDITERKRAEEQRRLQEAELAHVLRRASMGEMATALAHELSQPLAVVVNYANGLMHRLEESQLDTESTREALENIGKAGQRAKDILNHVGDFVRRGNPELSPERVTDLVDDVHAMLRQRLLRNNVHFEHRLQQDDTRVDVNRIEIKQVLFNLINNSIDALQQTPADDRKISLSLNEDSSDFVTLSVCDTGSGIAPEVATNLFEPYVTTKDEGLGMGLSICRTIVESHGGRLWHEPGVSRGACLCFRLPLAGGGDE
jgi:two-component system, LuxR family, sensor kinase FixL